MPLLDKMNAAHKKLLTEVVKQQRIAFEESTREHGHVSTERRSCLEALTPLIVELSDASIAVVENLNALTSNPYADSSANHESEYHDDGADDDDGGLSRLLR